MSQQITRSMIADANAILDALKEAYSLTLPELMKRMGKPLTWRTAGMVALNALHSAGRVSRRGYGKYSWSIVDREWDRNNPFAVKMEHNGEEVKEAKQEGKVEIRAEDLRLLKQLEAHIGVLESRLLQQDEALEKAVSAASQSVKEIEVRVGEGAKVKVEGRPHPKLEAVIKRVTGATINGKHRRLNVMLIGPAGSGKSYLARQVAECLDLDFAFITLSAGMNEGHLTGRLLPSEATPKETVSRYKALVKAGMPEEAAATACNSSGSFRYSRSDFVKCYEEGGVFLLDEVDAADPNVVLILNSALANGEMAVPNRVENPVAKRHANFVCIAAANTFGTGADRQYVGRNQLDEAFLDRFRMGQVVMDYDPNLEAFLCPENFTRKRVQHYRENARKCRVRRVISSRFLEEAYVGHLAGLSDAEIDEALFGGWSPDEIAKVKEGVVTVRPSKVKEVVEEEEVKDEESKEQKEMEEVKELKDEEQKSAPKCPRHENYTMYRMASNKGWRCSCPGNRWDTRNKRWTVCNECVFDHAKKA